MPKSPDALLDEVLRQHPDLFTDPEKREALAAALTAVARKDPAKGAAFLRAIERAEALGIPIGEPLGRAAVLIRQALRGSKPS